MPDITMCKGEGCPHKEGCYRYKATPSEYQSFFLFSPYREFFGCEEFWPILQWERIEDDKASSNT